MESKSRSNAASPAFASRTDEPRSITRRAFLCGVGKRAIYIAPVVVALSASQAHAASPSCVPSGEACLLDSDCCSNRCAGGAMICAMA
jgi:hypothetical protein